MNIINKRLIAGALALLSIFIVASRYQVVTAQETDDPVKIQIYKKFYDNRENNKPVAYQAARDYLAKYTKDKDQYVDYLQKWILFYERDDRKKQLPGLINDKKFTEAFSVGQKILADEPDYLRAQIDLGYAGYLAASSKNESFNAEALTYARKAIQALDAGKTPTEWVPFKGKDDTLAYLHYAVGYLTLKSAPDQAIESFLKAAQYDSDIKKTASTYYFLAVAYESGPYKTQSAAYQATYGGKTETPESKAALEKVNVVIDRMIDAYARAIATSGTDPKTAQQRNEWMEHIKGFYKFRHNDSEAGLTEYIAAALSRPLPPKP